jgi:hypothetical protein
MKSLLIEHLEVTSQICLYKSEYPFVEPNDARISRFLGPNSEARFSSDYPNKSDTIC